MHRTVRPLQAGGRTLEDLRELAREDERV